MPTMPLTVDGHTHELGYAPIPRQQYRSIRELPMFAGHITQSDETLRSELESRLRTLMLFSRGTPRTEDLPVGVSLHFDDARNAVTFTFPMYHGGPDWNLRLYRVEFLLSHYQTRPSVESLPLAIPSQLNEEAVTADEDIEIDLLTAGRPEHLEAAAMAETNIADVEIEAASLFVTLTEMTALLAEVVIDIDPNHMLHAELAVALDETRVLLSRCTRRPDVGTVTVTANPWGGARRVVEADV